MPDIWARMAEAAIAARDLALAAREPADLDLAIGSA
jgi:hypothetical protein